MKKQLLVASMVALTLCTTACTKTPTLKNGEEAVVSFDKKSNSISVDSLYEELKEKYAVNTLIDMMDRKLLSIDYPTDDEETAKVEENIKQIKEGYETYYKESYSSFEQFISAAYGLNNEEELKDYLALQQKRERLSDDYALKQVTDKEIEKYYKENTIGDMKASHILIKADIKDDMKDEEKQKAEEEAKKTAEEVISKLNNGDDFKKLAKKYSDDETVDLGWFNRGDMVDAFEEACIKLDKGQYTKVPVKTEYGYHVILKTGQKEKPKLEKVKESIKEELATEKKNNNSAILYEALVDYRKEKGIKINDKSLKRKYNAYMEQLIQNAKKSANEN